MQPRVADETKGYMMSNALNTDLRRLLAPGAGMLIPGAANALTGRIIELAGFKSILVTGAGVANTYLGLPDVGLTTMSEVVDHVARICDAVEIPVIADADTGFGNAINVRRTVRDFEAAGANGIQLEDQDFPKRCGHFEGKQVIPAGEMVQKIKAAVDARRNDSLVIVARTDAAATHGLNAALDRMAMYQEAGADVLFVEAPASSAELARIPKELPGPHLANLVYGGKTPLLTQAQLSEMGFAGIFYANLALQASMQAMMVALKHLNENGTVKGIEDSLATFQTRQEIIRFPEIQALEARYADQTAAPK